MAAYAVFEPPARRGAGVGHTDRFIFVRDGFGWGAFLLGPIWMAWRRLWLVLIGYVMLAAILEVLFRLARVPIEGRVLAGFLLALLIGFEAVTLRRWTLMRRGWHDLGIVVGDDLESAERRFFEAWTAGAMPVRPATASAERERGAAPARPASEVLGLFPQPGARR
jgi:hypothetical protein